MHQERISRTNFVNGVALLRRRRIYLGLTTAMMAWSGCASAQQATPAAQAAAVAPPPTGIADIIVTASRRSVSLQKESRSIDVLGSAALERHGITDPVAAQALVPGLSIAQNGAQLQVYVRGVGDRSITSANDPAVAINVDGVYYPKTYEVSGAFYDLERIEVLKGPQGTLYGRNASAGAINLITAKPKFDTEGFGEVEVGNYGLVRTTGAINTALSETVAIRAAGQVVRRDGYLTDGYNDDKSEAARVQVLWKPDAATSLILLGSYSHNGGKGDAAVFIDPNYPHYPWDGPTDPVTKARIALTNPGSVGQPKDDGFQDIKTYTATATLQHDMGWASLTLLPSYVRSYMNNRGYAALTVVTAETAVSNQYAMEARLSSPSGSRIKWVVGGLGSKEHVNDAQQSLIAPTYVLFNPSPKRDDITGAAFGEANASINDRFRLIGGLRYTIEHKDVVSYSLNDFAATPFTSFPITAPSLGVASGGARTDRALNFRAGAEYDVAPAVMVYATVATGFKAGGFYIDSPPNSYKPEKLTAYQGGFKSRFLDNRLQVNAEGFYWKYKDKQETFISISNSGSGYAQKTTNAGQATLYGADFSVMGELTKHDIISFEGEYLHSVYDSYINTVIDGGITNCPQLATYADGRITYNCSGKPLPHSPHWTGRISYDHTEMLANGAKVVLSLETRLSSSYYLQNDFTAVEYAKGYRVSDGSVTWTAPSGKLSATIFVKNIENKAVYTGATESAALGTLADTAAVALISPPRTFGGRVRVSF